MPSPVTVSDLIKSAMRLIGAVSTGDPITATESADGLSVLNDILEGWSTEHLQVYQQVNFAGNLVNAQTTYTIGTGGDFNTTRPINISQAFVSYQSIDYPITILTYDQYNAIQYKTQTGTFPVALYYEPAFPLGNIKFWPVPTSVLPVTIATDLQFTALTAVTQRLSLPPGYTKALRYQLAIELAAEYGAPISQAVQTMAIKTLGDIKRANIRPVVAVFDSALCENRNTSLGNFLGGFL